MADTGNERTTPHPAEVKETFASIGNETRAEILRILGEEPFEELSFSALRERLDEDIDSGQFNYHLQELLGQFVSETSDGYTLRPEGITLYRLIRAGSFTQELNLEPFDAGFECYFCGSGVAAHYDSGLLELDCRGCGYRYGHARLPPSAIDPSVTLSSLSVSGPTWLIGHTGLIQTGLQVPAALVILAYVWWRTGHLGISPDIKSKLKHR